MKTGRCGLTGLETQRRDVLGLGLGLHTWYFIPAWMLAEGGWCISGFWVPKPYHWPLLCDQPGTESLSLSKYQGAQTFREE